MFACLVSVVTMLVGHAGGILHEGMTAFNDISVIVNFEELSKIGLILYGQQTYRNNQVKRYLCRLCIRLGFRPGDLRISMFSY